MVVRSDVEASSSEKRIVVAELALRTPTNGTRIVTTTRLVVRDEKGGPSHLITVIDDVTDRRESDKKIVHMAHHDSLTDLPNRALLQERLKQGLTRVGRGESLAVFCLDLDDFKTVNDTLGHPVGDLLLQAVAERLRDCVRETDTVARFGGDEFAILQIVSEVSTDVTALARRIVESIHVHLLSRNYRVNVGISLGIAVAPSDGMDPDLLLKNADLALYRAKSEGRGSYRFFEPEMDTRMRVRRSLELDIRNALVNGELEMLLPAAGQSEPQRGLRFRSSHAMEPSRTRHGVPGRIHRGRGRHRHDRANRRMGPAPGMRASQKLAGEHDRRRQPLAGAVQKRKSGPDGRQRACSIRPPRPPAGARNHRVGVLENIDITRAALHQLRTLGIQISMDDFGTGYSSLGYLQSFPFDKIKIDRSFIKNLAAGHGSVAILKAIVSLADSLGMTTIAEGVETDEQLDIVRGEGCTEMQGYLFSAALPAAGIARFFPNSSERVESAA